MQDDFDNELDMPDDDMAGDAAATEDIGDLGPAADMDAEAEGGGASGEPRGRPSGGARAKSGGGGRKSGGRKAAAKAKKGAKKSKPAKKAKPAARKGAAKKKKAAKPAKRKAGRKK